MTPEDYADKVLARITMQPQGRWDADVVEFETKSMDTAEFKALIADAVRAAVAEEREACAQVALATNDCCECGNDGCHVGDLCPTAKKIRARA